MNLENSSGLLHHPRRLDQDDEPSRCARQRNNYQLDAPRQRRHYSRFDSRRPTRFVNETMVYPLQHHCRIRLRLQRTYLQYAAARSHRPTLACRSRDEDVHELHSSFLLSESSRRSYRDGSGGRFHQKKSSLFTVSPYRRIRMGTRRLQVMIKSIVTL